MDRVPNLDQADSFASYRCHAERWTLRIGVGVFGAMMWPPHEAFIAINQVIGRDSRSMQLDEIPTLWEQARERLSALELAPLRAEGPLFDNVHTLSKHFGLTQSQEETLLLRVMARLFAPLRKVLEGIGDCDEHRLAEVISIALGRSPDEVRSALQPDSTLFASGLLRLNRTVCDPINRLSPLSGMSGILTRRYGSFEEFFGAFVRQSPPATLAAEDFAHLDGKLDLLVSYLAGVCRAKSKGRNVLLYGVPGTGKTELARLATKAAGLQLYEAEVCGEEGQPLGVKERLHALIFLQRMVHPTPGAVALLDEVEDVFRPDEGPDPDKRTVAAADSKGWTVRLLENNPTPTIWISNRVGQIDSAVLRRFDLVMEVPVPPLAVRRRILERALGSALQSGPRIERILRDMAPAPALLARAASVLSVVSGRKDSDTARDLEAIVGGYLSVLGHRLEREPTAPAVPFNPKYLNSNHGPEKILATLRDGRTNRLLVYGPSGSGKTAFAHYVATQLEEPLVTATVRDLVSEEGWTDVNLRRVFAHARRDGAILLLDQVDWLVWAPFDHRPAHEQKTLDQLYACLDSHPEVVICTTTRAAGLEPGVVRRFPLRMRLNYLTGEQQRAFLGHLLGGDTAASEITAHFSESGAVAPGDMVAALQQWARGASPSPEDMFAALAEGQRLKFGVTGTAIGFSA